MPYDKFPTAPGEVFLGIGNDGQFARLCAALGHPEWASDPRFASNAERAAHRPALRALLEDALARLDGEALCTALAQQGVPAGPVRNIAEALQHPQTTAREMVVAIGTDYRGIGTPIKLSRTPGAARSAPPRFGEHTREVLRELGCSDAEIDSLIGRSIVAAPSAQGEPGLD